MQYYTLSDFHSISTKGFNVILPDTTVDLINNLSSLVGSPNYIKTPVFSKKEISYDNERRKRKDKHTKRGNDTSWTDKNKNNSNNSSNLDTTNSNIVFKSPSTTKKELTPVETYVKKIRTILNKGANKMNNEKFCGETIVFRSMEGFQEGVVIEKGGSNGKTTYYKVDTESTKGLTVCSDAFCIVPRNEVTKDLTWITGLECDSCKSMSGHRAVCKPFNIDGVLCNDCYSNYLED